MLEQGGRPVHRRLGDRGRRGGDGGVRRLRACSSRSCCPVLVLTVAAGVILSAPLWRSGTPTVEPAANTLLAVMYVGWLLGYGILLHQTSPLGDELILFVVGVTWVGETAAYLVGSTLGRRRWRRSSARARRSRARSRRCRLGGDGRGAGRLVPAGLRRHRRPRGRGRCSAWSGRSATSPSR